MTATEIASSAAVLILGAAASGFAAGWYIGRWVMMDKLGVMMRKRRHELEAAKPKGRPL